MTKIRISFLLICAALFALMLASCVQAETATRDLSAAALSAQVTPVPQGEEDQSEIGSTDGIMIMGVVIVAVTSLPLLLKKRK